MHEVIVDGKRQWQWTDERAVDYTQWDKGFGKEPTGSLKCATYHVYPRQKRAGAWKYVECNNVQSQAICMKPGDFSNYPTGEKLFRVIKNGKLIEIPVLRSDRLRIKTLYE
jgi:hypothetical protein